MNDDRRKGNVYIYYRGKVYVSGTERYLYTALVIWPQIVGGRQAIVQRYAIEVTDAGTIIDFWRCRAAPKVEERLPLVKAENWVAADRWEAKEFCQSYVSRHVAELQREEVETRIRSGLHGFGDVLKIN